MSASRRDESPPSVKDSAEDAAQSILLQSPLHGSAAFLTDALPLALVIIVVFTFTLCYSTVTRALLLTACIAAIGLHNLLPSASSTKLPSYDPLVLLDLPGETQRELSRKIEEAKHPSSDREKAADANSSQMKHHVSLSTPSPLFTKIRSLDLTPLIRVELNAASALLPPLPKVHHKPQLKHLKGKKHLIVNVLCGPRLMLRIAKSVAGVELQRAIGDLTGRQVLRLLRPDERYNFILAQRPLRLVLSHIGPGEVGGMYAKHALLAELGRVVYAGELWLTSEDNVVHINNASGTYLPEAELLPTVTQFLAQALQVKVKHEKRAGDEEGAEEEAVPLKTKSN